MNLPKNAIVNKAIPKQTFYSRLSISNKLKNEFIEKIQKITWAYKLSEKTLNIDKTKNVEEIQIFQIELKQKEIPKNILKLIDKAISYPILYIFRFEEDVVYGISLKEKGVPDNYYFSKWNEDIIFDFNAPNLEIVYQKIIKKFIKGLNIDNKKFTEIIREDAIINDIEKELGNLVEKRRREKQFNKKVIINQKIKIKQEELKKYK